MQKVINFLNSVINENDKIVIACSGGPDSMALLSLMCNLKNEKNFDIICAHVNHNKREESEKEALMVKEYCEKNNVIFEYTKFEDYVKGNFEAVARKKRYDFFESIMKKYQTNKLFTAHHGDDLAETILMRISRGSTLRGYSGFQKYNNSEWYELYRPLIFVTKDEILKYVSDNNVPYALDKTNDEDNYTRNRFRHHILKELKSENPKITTKFLSFSEKIDEASSYINDVVSEKIQLMYQDRILDLIKFNYEKEYIKKMMLKEILSRIYDDDVIYLKEVHITLILKAITNYKPNLEIVLPKKMRVLKRYDKLIFTDEENIKNKYFYLFEDKIEIDDNLIERVDSEETDSNFICRLNFSDITLPLAFRSRLPGDKIIIKGMGVPKKIKEIFIDAHIPKEKRDRWPILVDAHDEILWVPGLKKSKYNKSKEEKCDIILKCQLKEDLDEKR